MCGITTFAKRALSSRPLIQSAAAEEARRNTDFSDFIAATFARGSSANSVVGVAKYQVTPRTYQRAASQLFQIDFVVNDMRTDFLRDYVHVSGVVVRNSRAKSSNFSGARSEIAQ